MIFFLQVWMNLYLLKDIKVFLPSKMRKMLTVYKKKKDYHW